MSPIPGLHRNLKLGPDTGVVSTTVTGGTLVEADPSNVGFVRPASLNSITVLGAAWGDAAAAGSNPTSPLNVSWPHSEVAIEYIGDVDLTYATNAAYGQLLVAAAGGQVKLYTAGTSTFDQIVGRCTQPTGVTSGAVGRVRLLGV